MKIIELKFKDKVLFAAILVYKKSFEQKLRPSWVFYRNEDFKMLIIDNSDERIKSVLERICAILISFAQNPRIGGFKEGLIMISDKKLLTKALILDHQTPIITLVSIYPSL